ncbi:MAG: exostosin family protein [Chthoniobacterales bacterium]
MTEDAEAADIILFVESYGAGWHFERVRRHPFTRRYREKCFIFCANPFVIPFLPGIYTSINQRWASRRTISGFYLGLPKNEFTTFTPPTADLPYLFSFMGSIQNAPVRRQISSLFHPRSFFQDTSSDFARVLHRRMDARERRDYYRRYAEMTKASKFVLCPRGLSVSSIRLFETMRMGRAPVILSDGWVPPPAPSWEKFAIRVPEKDCAQIPRILEEREPDAVRMGELAREEWMQWFSEEAAFHRVVEWCLMILERRKISERLARWPVYLQYLRPFHFRRVVGGNLRAVRRAVTPSANHHLAGRKPELQRQGARP